MAIDRERKILEFLQKQGVASIQELVVAFGVSNMTIHRDLNKLEKAGLIQKKHGGVTLPVKSAAEHRCEMCDKPVVPRTMFMIGLEDGGQKRACCAHCGLMLHSQVKTAPSLTTDYLYGHIISASHAFYVIGSDVNICCVPSVLSFGAKDDAAKFKKGFGGTIASMQEALHYLHKMMRA